MPLALKNRTLRDIVCRFMTRRAQWRRGNETATNGSVEDFPFPSCWPTAVAGHTTAGRSSGKNNGGKEEGTCKSQFEESHFGEKQRGDL